MPTFCCVEVEPICCCALNAGNTGVGGRQQGFAYSNQTYIWGIRSFGRRVPDSCIILMACRLAEQSGAFRMPCHPQSHHPSLFCAQTISLPISCIGQDFNAPKSVWLNRCHTTKPGHLPHTNPPTHTHTGPHTHRLTHSHTHPHSHLLTHSHTHRTSYQLHQ